MILLNQKTGTKYVPPHLRNSQGGGNRYVDGCRLLFQFPERMPTSRLDSRHLCPNIYYSDSRNSSGGRGGGYRGGGRGGGRYNDSRSGSYQDNRGSYNDGEAPAAGGDNMPPQNSRWSNVNMGGGGGGGGYQGGRGNSGYRGGGGYGRGPTRNERGFHGDMRLDKRVEQRLFDRTDKQTTGINFDNYDKIPIEVSGEEIPDPCEEYSVDSIGEDLYRNTQLCGYNKPTPVQKYSVPIGSAGRDLMACAQTGSGKTAGFLFPIIMAMIKTGGLEAPDGGGNRRVYPSALILAPTRELAAQIHDEARRFTYATGIAPVVIYGGADARDQLRQIERGCDLLVATPGRLVDFIDRGRLAMENIRFLVLDEADRMLVSLTNEKGLLHCV